MAASEHALVASEPVAESEWDSAPPRRRITGFGFYIYLLSDGILFASLFAAFAVLRTATAGGPDGHTLFGLQNAFIETVCLLTSSLTCGLGMLACERRDSNAAKLLFAAHPRVGRGVSVARGCRVRQDDRGGRRTQP